MLSLATLSLVAFAGISLATPLAHVERSESVQQAVSITPADVDLLDRIAEYAGAAYCNYNTPAGNPIKCEANCDKLLKDKGFIIKSFLTPKTEIAGYVAVVESRQEIILATRGTVSWPNWEINLNFQAVASTLAKGAWIHRGYLNGWHEIAPVVRSALLEAQVRYPTYRIILTGHSLGGALVNVAAAYLRAFDGYILDLFTFGQPRVGNDVFCDFVSRQPGRLFRVTHGNDPVPRLPFAFLGYRHTSPEIWLTGNPLDPNNWPIVDIKTCFGNLNLNCNGNLSLPLAIPDHGQYFGRISCLKDISSDFVEGVYIPKDIQLEITKSGKADAILNGIGGGPVGLGKILPA